MFDFSFGDDQNEEEQRQTHTICFYLKLCKKYVAAAHLTNM